MYDNKLSNKPSFISKLSATLTVVDLHCKHVTWWGFHVKTVQSWCLHLVSLSSFVAGMTLSRKDVVSCYFGARSHGQDRSLADNGDFNYSHILRTHLPPFPIVTHSRAQQLKIYWVTFFHIEPQGHAVNYGMMITNLKSLALITCGE